MHRPHIDRELAALVRRGFDIYMNMCDGAADEDRPGMDVVLALEALNVPFTGAASDFYEPTREQMKQVCKEFGIHAPRGVTIRTLDPTWPLKVRMQYPLIVKHPNSYGSIGLIKESRVTDPMALRVQAERMVNLFGGALVEEFIEGREFSVLVSENPDDSSMPVTYIPVETLFPEGEKFKHSDMKWTRYNEMSCIPVEEPGLSQRLREITSRLFLGLNGTGYGRCDIRMDGEGDLYMLEINPQGAVFYPPEIPGTADYILSFDPRGHRGFLELLFRAAMKRPLQRKHFQVAAQKTVLSGL
jgi:D-alanine-D-alanine ligase